MEGVARVWDSYTSRRLYTAEDDSLEMESLLGVCYASFVFLSVTQYCLPFYYLCMCLCEYVCV